MGRDRDFDGLYGEPEQHFDDGFDYESYEPRGRVRRTLGCLVPFVLLGLVVLGGYAAYQHFMDNFGSPSCRVAAGGFDYTWDPEQTANASTIVDVGVLKLGMPQRASDVAVTTAIQESKLRNLTYGDLDSVGLFQQRPSQGWGTAEQIQDPVFASTSFYTNLEKIDGWQRLSIAKAAQEVQKSGFPSAYEAHTTQGETLTKALSGRSAEAVGCRLDDATSGTRPTQLRAKLGEQTGVRAQAGSNSVTYRAPDATRARAVAAWAVAHAESDGVTEVTVGDRAWQRQRGRDGWSWHGASHPTNGATTVRIDLAAAG